jgi:2-polyprenyl-6-hydroxyphenyl methylase/3-demethylubiquinone-9 3-methyltransferase
LITVPLAQKGYDVKGVDISENSLAVARRHAPVGLKLCFAQQDVYQLREEPGSYDAVLMMDLIEHLENQDAAISQASRALRPGGLLIFHTFNRTVLSYLVAVKGIDVLCRQAPENLHVHRLFVKPGELREMCAGTGLEVREFVGIRPRFFSKAFFLSLFARRVGPGFEFILTRSILVGYLGYAIKTAEGERQHDLRK